MRPITEEEFDELLHCGFEREALHLEMRDAYGTAVELPHMAKWASGENRMTWDGCKAGASRCASMCRLADPSAGQGSCPSR